MDPLNPPHEDFSDAEEDSKYRVPRQSLDDLGFLEISSGLPLGGTWRGYPLLADFTGDGRPDLVASNREEDGFSAWTYVEDKGWELRNEGLPRGMSYGPCASADLDGDGDADLIVNDHQAALRLFQNDGRMKWNEWPAPEGKKPLAMDLATGDLDGDGATDLVSIGHFNGGIRVYLNREKTRLEAYPGADSMLGERGFGRDVEIADVDQDGIPDIVAVTEKGVRVYRTTREPALAFQDVSSGLPVATYAGNTMYAAAIGRFLSDSPRPQIAVALVPDPKQDLEKRRSLGVFAWSDKSQSWEAVDRGLVRTEYHTDVHAADFDADGKLDLIAGSFQSGVVVYRGDGTGGFKPVGRLNCKSLGRLAVGDINQDGLPDVVMACPTPDSQLEPGGVRAFLNRTSVW